MDERTIQPPPKPRPQRTPYSARLTVVVSELVAGAPLWSVASEFEHAGLEHVLAADVARLPSQKCEITMWSHHMPAAKTLKKLGRLAWVESVIPERLDPGHPEMVRAQRRAVQFMSAATLESVELTITEALDSAACALAEARAALGKRQFAVIQGGQESL